MRKKLKFNILGTLFICMVFNGLVYAQSFPETRRVDWSNVGLEINRPVNYDYIVDICQPPYNVVPNPDGDWNTNDEGLIRAIENTRGKAGWKLIYFSQNGTYKFGSVIDLGVADSNLVFKGSNSNNVILFFKAADEVIDMFRISGEIIETIDVTNEISKGSDEITLQSGSLNKNIHYVDFFDNRVTGYSWAKVGQIFKVKENLGNNSYQLSDKFSYSHPQSYDPQIIKFIPAKNIGFEDITIKRDGGISRGSGVSCNIRFKYSTNCWVYGVESWGTIGWHFGVEKSSHIWIHGNFIHHANNYAGGDAYGVCLHDRSTNCLVENNIFNYLRHAMIVQSSATKNVFAYNYSYDKYCNADCNFLGDGSADISVHGTLANSNLFEGNMAEFLKADRSHGFNGDFNTFFRNRIGTLGFLNDIEIEFITSPNIIGNKCTELNHDLNVFSKLDYYGISNGFYYTHNYYGDNRGNLDPTIYWPDYSYYLQTKPIWLTGYSWPPIGPRISTNDQFPTNYIPGFIRHISGGKKTLTGSSIVIAPIISTLISNPTTICQGSWATIRCNLTQGFFGLKYYWTPVDFPANYIFETFGENANYCKVLIPNTATADMGHIPKVRCTVINSEGNSTKELLLTVGVCGGGCPFVYTWDGNAWVEDNNILPQSQDEAILGQDVTDYYQLYTKPKLESTPLGDRYLLSVGEFEEEKSYLDQLKLLVIDHSPDSYITVDDDGEIIQFVKPAYFASAELDSVDVYKQLQSLDNNPVEISESETLSLTFEDVSNNTENWLLLVAHSINAKEKIAGHILKKGNGIESTFNSFRLRENPTYQWVIVPQCSTNTLQVDINWEVGAEADYAELSRKVNLPFTVYTPSLIKAEHTVLGVITSTIVASDGNHATLNNGEMITLEFDAPALDPTMVRSFVFVSKGRYEHIVNKKLNKQNEIIIIPTENKLYDCYPNPFNPTTRIKYALKDDGKVTLKIFNSLGEEISTLVSELKSAGNYEAEFNASTLPSGVYIYSIQMNNFFESKKMILIK